MPASPIRRAGANQKKGISPARCRSRSKICRRARCLVYMARLPSALGRAASAEVAAQAGFSWPFGPIHLLAPHAGGPFLPVGADLCVRPLVLGAHIGAPLPGGGRAGAEAKASPKRRQRAAEGGGPCGWKRIEIFVGVGLSLTGRPGRVLPGQWRQWPGRPAPDAPPPAPGGGRSWPPAPQRRCRTPP